MTRCRKKRDSTPRSPIRDGAFRDCPFDLSATRPPTESGFFARRDRRFESLFPVESVANLTHRTAPAGCRSGTCTSLVASSGWRTLRRRRTLRRSLIARVRQRLHRVCFPCASRTGRSRRRRSINQTRSSALSELAFSGPLVRYNITTRPRNRRQAFAKKQPLPALEPPNPVHAKGQPGLGRR